MTHGGLSPIAPKNLAPAWHAIVFKWKLGSGLEESVSITQWNNHILQLLSDFFQALIWIVFGSPHRYQTVFGKDKLFFMNIIDMVFYRRMLHILTNVLAVPIHQ